MILDLPRISKALAGGEAGAAIAFAAGGGVTALIAYVTPAAQLANVPWWVYTGSAFFIAIVGYVGGFLRVYVAAENEPAPSPAAVAAAASVTKAEAVGAEKAATAAVKEIKA